MKIFLTLLCLVPFVSVSAEKPNIITILVDDMGYSDIGIMGSEIPTPHLDTLAGKGVLFTQMYNTAKCYSTRASLLSGVYFQQTDKEFSKTQLISETLKSAGYKSLWVGKHHANWDPRTRGFDRFYGFLGGATSFWNPSHTQRKGEEKPAKISEYSWILDGDEVVKPFVPPVGWYATDAFTDKALEWLDEYNKNHPFFMYVAFNSPHWPLHAHPDDIKKFKGCYDKGYEFIRQERFKRQQSTEVLGSSVGKVADSEWKKAWSSLSAQDKENAAKRMEIHAAMIKNIDDNVGRLVAKLKEQKRLDNTIILFLSDNGASSEGPFSKGGPVDGSVSTFDSIGQEWAIASSCPLFMYKGKSYEGGINTPMIVHWPKGIKKPGRIEHTPAHLVDFLATVVDVTGANHNPPKNGAELQGVSLNPVFKNNAIERAQPIYFEFKSTIAARDGQYKAVATKEKWKLFDVSVDRGETTDISKEMPEKLASMKKQWYAWFEDSMGMPYSDYRAAESKAKAIKSAKTKKRKGSNTISNK
ncbi:MAG: sulfatase-like hydrolase/transferase [Planctomycetes bacterium]|nr:sulfatase-like hydrolase/transferase [Planctomycetota bacterium]